MKNAIVITAKGGNKSVENKNIIPILGVPVVLYPVRAAKLSTRCDKVYISTEDDTIKDLALKENLSVIDRPSEISSRESQHKDVIKHAVLKIRAEHAEVENIIVLLGNTVMITPGLIDRCFKQLDLPDVDSIATVWKAQDDHPYRALRVDESGYARSFHDLDIGSNRQSYPDVYYYDQGVWGFKADCAIEQKGPKPWVWLGEKCKLVERPWVTGRDIHSWIDISASSWYLTAIQIHDFLDYEDV